MTTLFNVYSCLLTYPDDELLAALPAITATLEAADALATVQPLLDLLQSNDLISLQENYVATFDRTPSHSLHIFEHVHGESRDRGQAMVDLVDEYRQAGFDVVDSELPDYVPLFLEFLSLLDSEKALTLLDDVSKEYIDPTLYANYFTGAKLTNALLLNDRQYELNPGHTTVVGGERGHSKNKDAYFTFNVKIGYTFGRERIKR